MPEAQELDARVRAAVSLLGAAQHDDGGWAWTGQAGGPSDRYATARAVWALSLARRAGYAVPEAQFGKAVALLQNELVATAEADYETKAILLHALATVGKADFAVANRLYRERQNLSAGALVHLSLALAEMNRKSTAGELLDWLSTKPEADRGAGAAPPRAAESTPLSLAWCQSPAELQALWALAAQAVSPQSAKARELADWLMAHRRGHRWSPDKATGPATLALAQWFARTRFEGEKYTLSVFVNDVLAKKLDVDPAAGTQSIDVPGQTLKKEGRQRINFQITGRGHYAYQCILGGFVPAEKLCSTTKDWTVTRTYEPAPLELDGRDVPRGFDVLQGTYTEFRNPLTQLPVGRRGVVEIAVERKGLPDNVPPERLEYLVVTEPLPAGATVIEQSVRGGFERFEVSPEAITFYVGNRRNIDPIRYEVRGYLPGTYRAAPTVVRNAYRPEQIAVAGPKQLAVLPAAAKSSDPYRLTPEELFALGRHAFQKRDWKAARDRLTELLANWSLRPETYRPTVEMLLDVHLEIGPASQVVRCFEVVKEKWPEVEIPFAKIMMVGAAYHEMGEYERSYLVFRATVENSFLRDSGVAGFLEGQGQFLRSVDVLSRMLRDYPPESYIAEATYALAQHVYAKAPDVAADTAPAAPPATADSRSTGGIGGGMFNMKDDEKDPFADSDAGPQTAPLPPAPRPSAAANPVAPKQPRAPKEPRGPAVRAAVPVEQQRSKFNRVDLVRRAWRMLESFLTEYPDDPAADQAAFAAATALLDLRAYEDAAAACNRYAARYPKSDLLDSFWYVVGYCRFASGRHEAALEMCRKVADATRVDPETGRQEPSRNKWQAVYILGQVYHSLGKAADAVREYRRVEDQFVDARQSIAYFLRKAIELPEVVTLKPVEPAELELKFRNVAACDLKVYRIDLMKYSLLRRSLGGITQINLAGIRPHHQESIALGDGRDYRDRTRKLVLPLKEEGAYLVVCRGENLYASGMVLVSPLMIEVQADSTSGRVRTTVKDRVSDKYLHDVHVKVIGSGNEDFVSGQTDLRGVFVADGIRGGATVIAQAGPSRYAFYRAKEAVTLPSEAALAGARRVATQGLRASISLAGHDEAEEKIEAAFKETTQFEFTETPLTGAIDFLKSKHKIEIQLDRKALDDVGIGRDTPITANLKGVNLKSALRLVLRNLGLTYVIKDGVLLITTPEAAESELLTRIYPISDLVLPPNAPDGSQPDFDSLIKLIASTVKPTSWDEVGGAGSVTPFPNNLTLVVSQTQEVHEEIEDLLAQLRLVTRQSGGRGLPMLQGPVQSGAGRQENRRGSQGGGVGAGMGGMGGMMGGMGGSFGGPNAPPANPAQRRAAAQPQPADLLQGVQQTNKGFQGKQSEKLNKMYKESGSKGGVGAGGAF